MMREFSVSSMRFDTKKNAESTLRSILTHAVNFFESTNPIEVGCCIIVQEGHLAGENVSVNVCQEGEPSSSALELKEKASRLLSEGQPFSKIMTGDGAGMLMSIDDGNLCSFGGVWIISARMDNDLVEALHQIGAEIRHCIFRSKRFSAGQQIREALPKRFFSIPYLEGFLDHLGSQSLATDFICCWIEDEDGKFRSATELNLQSGIGIGSFCAETQQQLLVRDLEEGIEIDGTKLQPYHHEFLQKHGLLSGIFIPFQLSFSGKRGSIGYYFKRRNGCTTCDALLAYKITCFFRLAADEILHRTHLISGFEQRSGAFQLVTDVFKVLHDVENTSTILDGYLSSIMIDRENASKYTPSLKAAVDKLFDLTKEAKRLQTGAINNSKNEKAKTPSIRKNTTKNFARNLIHKYESPLSERNIDFIVTFSRDFSFFCNQVSLTRIVDNLINNASFSLGSRHGYGQKKIEVTLQIDHQLMAIIVSDNGPGFDSDESRLDAFEPFTSSKPGGWGLGLSICADLAQSMGGRVESSSRWGNGAAFTVKLPILNRQRK